MKAIFDTLSIKHIMIEEGQKQAVIEAEVMINNNLIETKLITDLSDLNRLFLKLNNIGLEISIGEDFEKYETSSGLIYTLDFVDKGWDEFQISRFETVKNIQQIRA